jgi:hypothetical protein
MMYPTPRVRVPGTVYKEVPSLYYSSNYVGLTQSVYLYPCLFKFYVGTSR